MLVTTQVVKDTVNSVQSVVQKKTRGRKMFFSAKRDVSALMQSAVWNKHIGDMGVVRELALRHKRARRQ